MIDIERAADLLELHEGNERFPYRCTAGKLTIGIGFNLDDVGLYPEEIEFILRNRIRRTEAKLQRVVPAYRGLSMVRKIVLVDMAYNLGTPRFLKFEKMLAALELRDYTLAAAEMLDSKWARKDVGARAVRLAEMMRTGEWPES